MYFLFGIPNCDTVKKAINFLNSNSIGFEFINFKKIPPTETLIHQWQAEWGELVVNRQGSTYKKLKDEFEKLEEQEKVLFLIQNSSMIKRPILVKGNKALCIGFDEMTYKEKLGI